jgi:hypothetical protein
LPHSTILLLYVSTVWYILEVFRLCYIYWKCFDCVIYFGSVSTVWYILEVFRLWYILEVFRLCDIFWKCYDCVIYFGNVPTVWYILEVFRLCDIFWKCSECVIYIFFFHFNAILIIVWIAVLINLTLKVKIDALDANLYRRF